MSSPWGSGLGSVLLWGERGGRQGGGSKGLWQASDAMKLSKQVTGSSPERSRWCYRALALSHSAFPGGGESKTLPAALGAVAVVRAALARGKGEARGIQSSCGSICGAKSFPTTELAALGADFIFHQLFPHGDLLSILQTATSQPLSPSCHFALSGNTNAKRLFNS